MGRRTTSYPAQVGLDTSRSYQSRVLNLPGVPPSRQFSGRILGTDGQEESQEVFTIFDLDIPPGATIHGASIDWTASENVTFGVGSSKLCVLQPDTRWDEPHTVGASYQPHVFHTGSFSSSVLALRSERPTVDGDPVHMKTNEQGRQTYSNIGSTFGVGQPFVTDTLAAKITRDGSRANTKIWLELWSVVGDTSSGELDQLLSTSDTIEFNSLVLQDSDFTGGPPNAVFGDYTLFSVSVAQQFTENGGFGIQRAIRLAGVTWGDDGGAQILVHGKNTLADVAGFGAMRGEGPEAEDWSPLAYPIEAAFPHLTERTTNNIINTAIPFGAVITIPHETSLLFNFSYTFGVDVSVDPDIGFRIDHVVPDIKTRIQEWIDSTSYDADRRRIAFVWSLATQFSEVGMTTYASGQALPLERGWNLRIDWSISDVFSHGELESSAALSTGVIEASAALASGALEGSAALQSGPIEASAALATGVIEASAGLATGPIEAGG